MLELIDGLPDHVVGVRAIGEVSDDDYEDVLVPTIDDRRSRHDRIRLLYVLAQEFTGYEADAMWEDAKLGMRTLGAYDRIAVVTDASWMRRAVSAFGWLIPGDVRTFDVAELDQATTWITE